MWEIRFVFLKKEKKRNFRFLDILTKSYQWNFYKFGFECIGQNMCAILWKQDLNIIAYIWWLDAFLGAHKTRRWD